MLGQKNVVLFPEIGRVGIFFITHRLICLSIWSPDKVVSTRDISGCYALYHYNNKCN